MSKTFFSCIIFIFHFLLLNAFSVDTSRWASSSFRLNTEASESNPILSADGQTMYFVRGQHLQNFGEEDKNDIWVSYRDSAGMWSNSVNIGAPLNNDQDNKVVGVNLTNDVLYLTGDSNNKVFISKNKNRTWSFPRAIEIPGILNSAPVLNCHVSIDEQHILLALNTNRGLGERDLYVCQRDERGNWMAPISLGDIINTNADEANVFLSADNKTLYFCSNGAKGFGGYDWFVSRRIDNSWTNWTVPVNMGATINSERDDLFFCINTELGEIYGVRTPVDSDSDIERFLLDDKDLLPAKTTIIYGKVLSPQGEAIQTIVEAQDLQHAEADFNVFSKSDGKFLTLLNENQRLGFYALDRNSYASMAFANLTDRPLKVLDNGRFQSSNIKDSIHFFNTESILIRINELDYRLAQLEKNHPKSFKLDLGQIQKFMKQPSNFEVNQNIEKIRKNYNQKHNKTESTEPSALVFEEWKRPAESNVVIPNAADISHIFNTPEKVELMKKGFEDQKKRKGHENRAVVDDMKGNELTKEEERQAIDEIGQLHDNNARTVPDFEVLLANVKNRILFDEFARVKVGLQKDLIWEWNGWKDMGFTADEERKLKVKVDEVQKKLKVFFEQKNIQENPNNNVDVVLYEDDKIIYKELKSSVVNSMTKWMKEKVKRQIDYEMKSRLYIELKNIIIKELEKEKRLLKSEEHTKQVSPDDKLTYSENERNQNVVITLFPLVENESIPLSGIFFEANGHQLLPESNAELNRIIRLLSADPFKFIEIGSHTHSYCNDFFAADITQKRADAIKQALVGLGADGGHILARSYAKSVPISPNNTVEGRLKNQRIELKILQK